MNEEVFFVINGKELVLDKVLVEFNEAPIFFVCKSGSDYYIASCIDIEQERYLVAKTGLSDLSKMMHGKITMRNLILQAQLFWDIIVGEEVTKDIVIEQNVETISQNELPYEGAYLSLATKDLERYLDKIDNALYGEGIWENKALQIGDECVEEIFKMIGGQYEVAMQNIYESTINDLKKKYCHDIDHESVYNKKICNEGIEINTKNTELRVAIDDDVKRLWAA